MNDFSAAIRITHFFNFVFLSLLVRSGIEILGGHPKLYWNDHCHVALVIAHGFGSGMARIVLGSGARSHTIAVIIGLGGIAIVCVLNLIATRASLRRPLRVRRLLEIGIEPLWRLVFHHWGSRQDHVARSEAARVNGHPPRNERYLRSVEVSFEDWRLQVDGLVEAPLSLSLADLRTLPTTMQSTLHVSTTR